MKIGYNIDLARPEVVLSYSFPRDVKCPGDRRQRSWSEITLGPTYAQVINLQCRKNTDSIYHIKHILSNYFSTIDGRIESSPKLLYIFPPQHEGNELQYIPSVNCGVFCFGSPCFRDTTSFPYKEDGYESQENEGHSCGNWIMIRDLRMEDFRILLSLSYWRMIQS